MDEPHIERTTDEARAGSTPGIVRWVLLISLSLALLALGLVAVIGMWARESQPGRPATEAPAPATTASPR